jgi:hypothetical protein
MGQRRDAFRALVLKPELKTQLVRPGHILSDIRMHLEGTGCGLELSGLRK